MWFEVKRQAGAFSSCEQQLVRGLVLAAPEHQTPNQGEGRVRPRRDKTHGKQGQETHLVDIFIYFSIKCHCIAALFALHAPDLSFVWISAVRPIDLACRHQCSVRLGWAFMEAAKEQTCSDGCYSTFPDTISIWLLKVFGMILKVTAL